MTPAVPNTLPSVCCPDDDAHEPIPLRRAAHHLPPYAGPREHGTPAGAVAIAAARATAVAAAAAALAPCLGSAASFARPAFVDIVRIATAAPRRVLDATRTFLLNPKLAELTQSVSSLSRAGTLKHARINAKQRMYVCACTRP